MTFDELYESVLERLGEKKAERDYKREYELYHAKPEQKKRRAKRNEARAKMEKAGKVKKGDGKDVDHVSHNVNNNSESNLKVMDAGKNRAKNLGKGGRPKGT
jgi:hypothetical protein